MIGQDRYREIFDAAPVSLWDVDFSGVAALLDRWRAEGTDDLRAHLMDHPEEVEGAIRRISVLDVNSFTLDLFEVDRNQDLLHSLAGILLPDTASIFIDMLVTLWNGLRRFGGETRLRTVSGREVEVAFTLDFRGARFERTLVSLRDITAQKSAERAGIRLAALIDSSEDAILTKDLDSIITSWNRGATELFGYAAEEAIGKPVTMLMPAERRDEEPAILARIRAGERIEHYETVRQHKDGTLIDISLSVSPLKNADGTIIGASKIARDITEQKRAQEQEHLLIREMNHRIKNLFALASSIISLSARDAETPQALKARATERLAALARVHSLTLAPHGQIDAAAAMPTTLHALIKAILSPYDEGSDAAQRIALSGDDLQLSPSATTSFALLVHEFATNAAKYGALSNERGTITIESKQRGDRLIISWIEREGPAVAPPASSEGFGSYLAKATVKTLNGQINHDWDPVGVTVRLDVAVSRAQG
ncbi:PAS domain S-box protein [Dongia sedimenti]|uniref:histidine kinase n=1 Tax=Dongia sedimenti TaxID=3064282 RepID=A0ABU0YUN5_9PROT|nr:PAS domain S-box protein [Rhodospirillaceae bacterium R-7]